MASMGGGGGGTKETEAQKAQGDRAVRMIETRRKYLRPVERQMVDRAMDTDFDRQTATGDTNARIASAFGDAGQQAMDQRIASGGGLQAAIDSLAGDNASARSRGLSDVESAVEDIATSNKLGLVDYGLGKAESATQGFGQLARQSVQRSMEDAEIARQNAAGRAQLVGAGIGAAAAAGTAGMPSSTGIKSSNIAGDGSILPTMRTVQPGAKMGIGYIG